MSTGEATTITVGEVPESSRQAPTPSAAAPAATSTKRGPPRFAAFFRKTKEERGGWKRGVACFDFIIRFFALATVLAAAIIMGTTRETLPFVTEHFQFHANFSDLPALTFFVVGTAIAAGYLLLSLPFALAGVCLPRLAGLRLLLLIFDTVILVLTTAAAASATSIVYLAHTGNDRANWVAICLRFDGFCQRISAAVVLSFVAVVLLVLLIMLSAIVLSRH